MTGQTPREMTRRPFCGEFVRAYAPLGEGDRIVVAASRAGR
jgi:hypothetical protein